MSRVVLKAEDVSKMYRLGLVSTKSLKDDLNRWWHLSRGKEDPYLKIGEANDRTVQGNSGYVWALKDVNFEINQGDSVGIIGRNGAGKSTLLKILSRVTQPTSGNIKIKGRIASLLEVGTGFHPELTGKENIFLNGAILGMRKGEIKRKLDEIIDFSGVQRYIDTPVKRYSTGMYVRLAFAVAAHLESEILIVDEVLAVGDAEFQKKCLGKMNEVSQNEGRTVLFVSHNMAAVQNLCSKSLLIKNGTLVNYAETSGIIQEYLRQAKQNVAAEEGFNPENRRKKHVLKLEDGQQMLTFRRGKVVQKDAESNVVSSLSPLKIRVEFDVNPNVIIKSANFDIGINNSNDLRVAWLSTNFVPNFKLENHHNHIEFDISNLNLAPDDYDCTIYCSINGDVGDWFEHVLPFTIMEKDYYNTGQVIPFNKGQLLLQFTHSIG